MTTTLTASGPAPSSADDWHGAAACADWDFKTKGDPWHPTPAARHSDRAHSARDSYLNYAPAREICKSCPVRQLCLTEHLEIERVPSRVGPGMVGGLTPDERRRLLRQRTT